MGQNTRRASGSFHYHMEDMKCQYCLHYPGKKKPCPLPVCCCAEEKRDALAQGRIKRKPGSLRWNE